MFSKDRYSLVFSSHKLLTFSLNSTGAEANECIYQ